MKCAVHQELEATGFCRNCGKAMCPACARPIRDVLYCENCLAAGMGIAAPVAPPPPANPYAEPMSAPPAFVPPPVAAVPPPERGAASGAIAFFMGLFPGLGAVYNGEYNKALVHVVVFVAILVSLVSAANEDDVSVGAIVTLALMLAGFVLYMAFDSMRVAQAKATGETLKDPLNEFSKNMPIGPIILIGFGGLWLLSNFRIFDFLHLSIGRLWPLIFIAIGVMLFRKRTSN